MKALVLEGPGQAVVRSIDRMPAVGPEEILLAVRWVGLCGSDLNSYRGRNPLVSFPRIPGHEIGATVAERNPRYPQWELGMALTASPYSNCGGCAACLRGRLNACRQNQTLGVQRDGALTEYVAVRADRLFRAELSLKELCLVEPLTVGFHAAARGRVEAADTVVVFGCGGVGLGAVAGSAFRGARVIGVDVDDAKLATARRAGAAETVNTTREDLHAKLAELTAGRGPDVCIEAIGLPQTFRAAVKEVAFTGRVVYIGYAKEPVTYETRLFVQKELDILGSRNAQPEDFRAVIAMLEAKRFPAEEMVTHTVTLEETPAILEAWGKEPARFGKIQVAVKA
ncbi:MAG: zinc-binding alcohol dehydrogenase family protein [Terracidiphilus sp.]|nr:zinc-binding alcohol dehydrogenase family protein [Terracidiphilus sp.]